MKFIIFSTTVQSIVKGMKWCIHTSSDINFTHFWVYSEYWMILFVYHLFLLTSESLINSEPLQLYSWFLSMH